MDAAGSERPRILCVDDEAHTLEGLKLMIGSQYDVHTAPSGEAALALMLKSEPFAAVISDNHMPGMTGADFLQVAREQHKDTVRILLTGYSDLEAAIAAVNRGGLFRFLLKPCTREMLEQTLSAAVEQHNLQLAERELLQKTLLGSMRALLEVLAVVDPVAFGRVGRLKELSLNIADRLGVRDPWQLEYAALVSQLGYAALPDATLRKVYHGVTLSNAEAAQMQQANTLSAQIVSHIPRLGRVSDILLGLTTSDDYGGTDVRREVHILKAVSAFKVIEQTTSSRSKAIAGFKALQPPCDAAVSDALLAAIGDEPAQAEVLEIPIERITVGMTVLHDVYTRTGALLIARGTRATESFVARLRNVASSIGPTMVRVARV
jgi:CheY-like chemotaxis protein